MAMEWQTTELELRAGIDTKTDRKLVKTLLTLQNGEFRQFGAINKRGGYRSLSVRTNDTADVPSNNVTTGISIFSTGSKLQLFDGRVAYGLINTSFSAAQGSTTWAFAGHVFNAELRWKAISRLGDQDAGKISAHCNVAYTNGYFCYIGYLGQIQATIIDKATDDIVFYGPISNVIGSTFQIVTLGNTFVVLQIGNDNTLRAYYWDTDNVFGWVLGWSTPASVDGSPMDAITFKQRDGSYAGAVAYQITNNVGVIRVASFTKLALSGVQKNDNGGGNQVNVMSLCQDDSGVIYLYYYQAFVAPVYCRGINNDVSFTTKFLEFNFYFGVDTNLIMMTSIGMSDFSVVYIGKLTGGFSIVEASISRVGGILQTPSLFIPGFFTISRPFRLGDEIYLAILPFTQFLALTGFFTLPVPIAVTLVKASPTDVSYKQVVGYLAYGLVHTQFDFSQNPSNFVMYDTDKWIMSFVGLASAANPRKPPIPPFIFSTNTLPALLLSGTVDFSPSRRMISAQSNKTEIVTLGSIPYHSASTFYNPLGFFNGPIRVSGNIVAGAGLADGTYEYRFHYRWIDTNGKTHRSVLDLFPLKVITGAGNNVVNIFIPSDWLETRNEGTVFIDIYRTQANGSVLYYLDSIVNDTSVASQTYVDSHPDSDLILENPIYTTGGYLEAEFPESSRYMLVANNRIWLVVDDNEIWFSKSLSQAVGPEFHFELNLVFDQTGGKILALAEFDGTIFVLRETAIWAFSGDGPNNLGVGEFNEPRVIAHDIGCRDPRSVVTTQHGIYFQSHDGYYLLGRDLVVQPIGLPVFAYDSATTTSARYLTERSQIRVTKGVDAPMLVYDLLAQQWSTFSSPEFAGFIDQTVWQGKHVGLQANGTVWVQDNEKFADDFSPVVLSLSTGWIDLTKLQDFKRIRWVTVLGEKLSGHTLVMNVFYDYIDTAAETVTFDTTTAMATGDTLYQFRHRVSRQKCQSIRLDFADMNSIDLKQSYSISAILLEVGLLPGTNRLPQPKTV